MGRCFETAGVLNKAGIKICITADHDVTPIYYLSVYAAQSVRAGLDEIEGLKAVTKNPAEVLGLMTGKASLWPAATPISLSGQSIPLITIQKWKKFSWKDRI